MEADAPEEDAVGNGKFNSQNINMFVKGGMS
jgi:hypothetical protein